jgi:hypothetical protein
MHLAAVVMLVVAAACRTPIDELDGAFYAWDERRVHCAVEVDDRAHYELEAIFAAIDRAAATGEVLELLVHTPGVTMTWAHLEALLDGVHVRHLPFLTISDVLRGPPQAGVALMYDDSATTEWTASMAMLAQYNARVTLYVSRYPGMTPSAHAQLRELAAAGHDVEAHSVFHERGPGYVEQHGLSRYLGEEVLPSIELLRADGYEVVSYAYPFGARTDETDRAILDTGSVQMVRSLAKPNQLRSNPCPH